MIQIFFISPNGASAVKTALDSIVGQGTHGWRPDGATDKQVIGVCEVTTADPDLVCEALEAQGVLILPDHKTADTIAPEHYQKLKQHGVLATDTCKQAMTKIHGVSGFRPILPKRF